MYLNSLATLTPAGDLVVSTDDLIQNGPHARQLMSLLPFVGSLAVVGVIFKAGKRSAKVTRSVANKLGKLTEAVRKKILQLAAKAKNDAEAADIIRREVEAVVGTGQTHHAISSPVHQALERHPILKGKYKYRDSRFEAFAKDLPSHEGYPEWHRKLDAEVSAWIDRNKHATEEGFERFLQERYDKEDLRKLFPRGLEGGAP